MDRDLSRMMVEPEVMNRLVRTSLAVALTLLAGGAIALLLSVTGALDPAPTDLGSLKDLLPEWMKLPLRRAFGLVTSAWMWSVLVVALAAEWFAPAVPSQRLVSKGMVHDLVVWSVLDRLLLGWFIGAYAIDVIVTDSVFGSIGAGARLSSGWPPVVEWVVAFVAIDLLNWSAHYALHRVGFLWSLHALHHSQPEMNALSDSRVHPLEHLARAFLTMLPLVLLGLPYYLGPAYMLIQRTYTTMYHANIRSRYGPLRWILVTPQSHRIHHSSHPEHADKNFGSTTCLWDKFFGTHYEGGDEYPETGIADADFPIEQRDSSGGFLATYLRQIIYPFTTMSSARTTRV